MARDLKPDTCGGGRRHAANLITLHTTSRRLNRCLFREAVPARPIFRNALKPSCNLNTA